jgi:hypothetical protein
MFNFHHQREGNVLLNEQSGAIASITNNENGNNRGNNSGK